jgi:flavin reductase (DIM6/NTAB) family NADH-FMN oxidoreductase RutF
MWKDWARPFVRPLPQWSVVAVAPPQQTVVASLRWGSAAADVTTDHTVASLRPLTIATSLDAGPHPVIEYRDRASGRLLGVLQLARATTVSTEGNTVTLYHVAAGGHRCLAWPLRPWNAWLQNRLMRRNTSSPHSLMAPAATQQLMIAYLCPRPVVLVSVDAPDHHNIFPMDLIGPLGCSGLFTLALRSTNVSVPTMRKSRRVALSCMPATMKDAVYALSVHHKQPLSDWETLPFPVRRSRAFGMPAVATALRIRELDIVHSEEVGSHTLFLGRIVSEETQTKDAQLHHTAGFHQAWRRRRGMPFAEARSV